MAPFLSVITRCYKRPIMLAKNKASLKAQTDRDFEHLFIRDDKGRGVGWANGEIAKAEPTGEYVLVLDDDDMMLNHRAIAILKLATLDAPGMVIFKADHKELGILPSKAVWQSRPMQGQIGSISFISRLDIWKRHAKAYGVPKAGDYNYLHAAWPDVKDHVVWLNELLTGVQRISWGQPE